jgi:hypothetical protein
MMEMLGQTEKAQRAAEAAQKLFASEAPRGFPGQSGKAGKEGAGKPKKKEGTGARKPRLRAES